MKHEGRVALLKQEQRKAYKESVRRVSGCASFSDGPTDKPAPDGVRYDGYS